MDRLISEQAVFDVINKHLYAYTLIPQIKAIPSADKWIPVSERLPEEKEWIGTKRFGTTISDEVYVTMETPSGHRFCEHIRFQNGNLSMAKQAEMDALFKGAKPIAWMPLPSPYKGEQP